MNHLRLHKRNQQDLLNKGIQIKVNASYVYIEEKSDEVKELIYRNLKTYQHHLSLYFKNKITSIHLKEEEDVKGE